MIFLGKIMKTFTKILILSFLLIALSVSSVNALELDDDMQTIEDSNLQEISIDEVPFDEMQEDSSSVLESNQYSDDDSLSNHNQIDDEASVLGSNQVTGENTILNSNEGNNDNPQNNILSASNGNIHKLSPSNYTKYFNNNGYVNTNIVKSGDTIDLSGKFNKVNFTFTIPCSITSSQKNAYLNNCVVQYLDVNSSTYSNVSNLKFTVDIEKHPSVYIVRSSHINVFNCNAFSTGANSNPTLLVGSTYCNIHHNVFETTFTGYMNMSWKRAGILLGESHYNNIYSNDVTIKDSNGIYLTTYGFEKSNYNNIYNNTIRSSAISEETGLPNPSAWAYGVHIMGDYNKAINNTIYLMYRGVDSEGSYNQIIGNDIYNLAGSYYEGNDGTDGGEYGIHASYDNTIINNTIHDSKITGSAIYMAVNCIAYGNIIQNISGEHGFEFSTSASHTLLENNFIGMSSGNGIYIRGNMTNVTLSNNTISSPDATAILIKMLSKSKYPDILTIKDNRILDFNKSCIDFSEIEPMATSIRSYNNSIILNNATFFNYFDSQGILKNIKGIDNLVFKGAFSNLGIDSIIINQNISILGENSQIVDIPFVINSSNLKIENIILSIGNGFNAFSLDNVENISFINNAITVDSKNYALTLNHSRISMLDNIIHINEDNPAILNDNGSYISYGENIIATLAETDILSLNGSIVKITVYIVSDDNYDSVFDLDGRFYEDFDIAIGDTLKIANLTNKTIRIDIPLIITSYKDSIISNSTIILEDMASNANLSNLKFKLENNNLNKDFSFIIIKDGVSNLIIKDNQFNLNGICGSAKVSAIQVIGSDYSAQNIILFNNIFNLDADLDSIAAISVMNDELANYENISDALTILNNSISIYNSREDGLSYGINVKNSNNLKIESNNISSIANLAFGIYLEKASSSNIRNNFINVSGFNHQRFIDYMNSILSSSDFDIGSYVLENSTNIDAAIFAKNSQKSTIMNNHLYENNYLVSIIHSNNPSKDIQNSIDNAKTGDTINLGNNLYSIKDSIVINKSISLVGGILLGNIDSRDNKYLKESDDSLFVISGKNTVNLLNMTVILNDNDLFVLSLLKNSSNPNEVHCPIINIKNNILLKNNDAVLTNSLYLAKSISERPLLKSINDIQLQNNMLIEKMNQIRHYLYTDSPSNEINFNSGIKTALVSSNLAFTALDKNIYGSAVSYVEVKLLDKNNKLLAGKKIHILYNNKIYSFISNNKGVVRLPVNINSYGISKISISFLGDSQYMASFSSAKVIVKKQKASLLSPNRSYLVTSKKYLKATLKDKNGKLVKNKKISFILNGKTYKAYTNSKGVATVKIKASTAKTYVVTVKFAGDSVYSPISKSLKLYVKKVKTKLIVKNRSYRKSKKIKKLTAVLRTKSGKAIKGKKLVFKIGKKKYKAKTNKKGKATLKVKLSKRKTYKFTVKFAGDKTYLKASKKAKLRLR